MDRYHGLYGLYESFRNETPQQVVSGFEALAEDDEGFGNEFGEVIDNARCQVDELSGLEGSRRSLVLARIYLNALLSKIPSATREGIREILYNTDEILGRSEGDADEGGVDNANQ